MYVTKYATFLVNTMANETTTYFTEICGELVYIQYTCVLTIDVFRGIRLTVCQSVRCCRFVPNSKMMYNYSHASAMRNRLQLFVL